MEEWVWVFHGGIQFLDCTNPSEDWWQDEEWDVEVPEYGLMVSPEKVLFEPKSLIAEKNALFRVKQAPSPSARNYIPQSLNKHGLKQKKERNPSTPALR